MLQYNIMAEKLCKRCNTNPVKRGTRSSGKTYLSSYCVDCIAHNNLQHRIKRDNANVCMSCGEKREANKKRCNKCALAFTLNIAVRNRNSKRAAVEFCGGACVDCGLRTDAVDVYDFHHIDPAIKERGVGDLLRSGWDKVVEELKKCILLCSNCHRKRERQIDLERLQQRCNDMGIELPAELKETNQDGNRSFAPPPKQTPRDSNTVAYTIN